MCISTQQYSVDRAELMFNQLVQESYPWQREALCILENPPKQLGKVALSSLCVAVARLLHSQAS